MAAESPSYCSTSYFIPNLQQCSKSYHHLNHSDTQFSKSTICLSLCSKCIQAIPSSSLLPPEQGLAYTHPCNWNSVHFTLLKKTVHDCLCNHSQLNHLEKATTRHYLSSLFLLLSKPVTPISSLNHITNIYVRIRKCTRLSSHCS